LRYAALMLRYAALCFIVQGATLLPIIMWADGTWLSVNGNHTAKPCLVGIGNHPLEVQHKVESKKVSVWLCAALMLRLRSVSAALRCAHAAFPSKPPFYLTTPRCLFFAANVPVV
jgi:hypothetical protein